MIKVNNLVKVRTDDDNSWLVEKRYFHASDYPDATFEYSPSVTGSELADFIDSELESNNYHSFVGVAEELYKAVKKVSNEDTADKFIKLVYDKGILNP